MLENCEKDWYWETLNEQRAYAESQKEKGSPITKPKSKASQLVSALGKAFGVVDGTSLEPLKNARNGLSTFVVKENESGAGYTDKDVKDALGIIDKQIRVAIGITE